MLPPEVLATVVQRLDDPLERWQTAAAMAMAGCFGCEWKNHLRGFWADEARAFGSSPETGPYHTADDLRRAARCCGYQVRGLKKSELRALVPQTVPPGVVYVAREANRDRRVARDVDAYLATADDATITATDAKKTYCVTEDDLDAVSYEARANPHYRSGPMMRLYRVRDVVVAAYEKHGGAAGLAAAQTHREARVQARASAKARVQNERHAVQAEHARARADVVDTALANAGLDPRPFMCRYEVVQYVSNGIGCINEIVAQCRREAQLRAALCERGLELRTDSRLCEQYIQRGHGNIAAIVETMDEMRFYHTHTTYATFREQVYRRHRMSATEISAIAKERAWKHVLKHRTREWLLRHLPPSLRPRLLDHDQHAEDAR
jgi:hypothetical protein